MLPKEELNRVDEDLIEEHYRDGESAEEVTAD
jgi:V/A-type H+-transporting ATPase subunit B